MYYVNLGLKGYVSPTGAYQPDFGIFGNGTYGGQNDVGLIDNLQSDAYWSGLENAPNSIAAWFFYTTDGGQSEYGHSFSVYAWAVSPGDVAAVPEAQTYALMLAGLGLIGWRARRRG